MALVVLFLLEADQALASPQTIPIVPLRLKDTIYPGWFSQVSGNNNEVFALYRPKPVQRRNGKLPAKDEVRRTRRCPGHFWIPVRWYERDMRTWGGLKLVSIGCAKAMQSCGVIELDRASFVYAYRQG